MKQSVHLLLVLQILTCVAAAGAGLTRLVADCSQWEATHLTQSLEPNPKPEG